MSRIQPSKSDAQLNYSAHLSDRRVPDVLDPTAEVEVEVEEEDPSYAFKKGKNSKRGKRQKRKKQSTASGSNSAYNQHGRVYACRPLVIKRKG